MSKYHVLMSESLAKTIEIEAKSEDEAWRLVDNGEWYDKWVVKDKVIERMFIVAEEVEEESSVPELDDDWERQETLILSERILLHTLLALTDKQKQMLRDVKENGEGLADPDGGWQHDLAAVCETGSMIVYLLEQAFPFLIEEIKDE